MYYSLNDMNVLWGMVHRNSTPDTVRKNDDNILKMLEYCLFIRLQVAIG